LRGRTYISVKEISSKQYGGIHLLQTTERGIRRGGQEKKARRNQSKTQATKEARGQDHRKGKGEALASGTSSTRYRRPRRTDFPSRVGDGLPSTLRDPGEKDLESQGKEPRRQEGDMSSGEKKKSLRKEMPAPLDPSTKKPNDPGACDVQPTKGPQLGADPLERGEETFNTYGKTNSPPTGGTQQRTPVGKGEGSEKKAV